MDFLIRQHLSLAGNQQDAEALLSAYTLIKATNGDGAAQDAAEKFSCDVYVLCAEQAIQLGNPAVAEDCLHMYFKNQPPLNQFFGRAYLCKAQLHSPRSAENVDDLEDSVAYYLKAIDFAKQNQRYHFLVYNASILYWQMVRPFLKPGSRHLVLQSLVRVVKALDETDDADKSWRADLMLELLECFLDAQKLKESVECASYAADFIRTNVPEKYPLLFSKMVHHKLIDSTKASKETRSSVTLSVIYKIQKLRSQMDSSITAKEVTTSLNDIYKMLVAVDGEQELKLSASEKIPLLIELAQLSIELNVIQLAATCIADLKISDVSDPRTVITLQCLQSQLDILKLSPRINTYAKSVVEAQLRVIRRLESTLQDAVRLGEPNTIQNVCTTQWNICLPLLQHNLRKHLKKPLVSIAEALENIDSLLTVLRCQIHLEIAQIEEEEDRIEVAIGHIHKAMNLDGNGQYQNFLKSYLHRLQLRTALYTKPQCPEDQAAMIIEQAKQSNSKDSPGMKRSLLVNAGLCLAPDVFQMVLDSENGSKVSTGKTTGTNKGLVSYLCMKAQHHTKCIEKTSGHLQHAENENDTVRVKLWADLAKVARKHGVWDVCRAACRFCLLYDDGRWSASKQNVIQQKKSVTSIADEGGASELELSKPKMRLFSDVTALLRTLAEIRFINAEATIHLLKSEGCKLNENPVPPEDKSMRPASYVPANLEKDPEWIIYSDWIIQLSAYATDNFLNAAELGVELQEPWITHNAAVYILNHNRHIVASQRITTLVDTLKKLLTAFKRNRNSGNPALLVMLSNALAKGLILRWIPMSDYNKRSETRSPSVKGKKALGKGPEKSNVAHVSSIDPNGLPDVKLALEVCDYALDLTNGSSPVEVVPISIRQQLLSTWVKAKQLLQQQIGGKLGTDDEENNDGQNSMTRVLVALEMYACNGIGLMDFTVPNLSQVLKMALDCKWTDSLVELQTLTRLAHFAYNTSDLELALACTQRALTFDEGLKKQDVHSYTLGCEMLSAAACIQGQSIMDKLAGKKHLRRSAIKAFEMSARFGSEAGNQELTVQAARHFWHACSPLKESAKEREPLKDSVTCVIRALNEAGAKSKQVKENDTMLFYLWPNLDVGSCILHEPENTKAIDSGNLYEEVSLKAALYDLLFNMYADKNDWETGLKVLDEAINILPRTRHRLVLFKHRVLVKARLGHNFFLDIQKFKDESEDYVSYIWHHVAMTCTDTQEQLACYLNAIDVLQKPESEWQKVEYLLELAEWLYCRQFPLSDAMNQLDWAVDILLNMKLSNSAEEGKNQKVKTKTTKKVNLNKEPACDEAINKSATGEQLPSSCSSLEDIRNVRQLETLARAHILMAKISGCGSPDHEQHSLMAYAYIMQIWQESLSEAASYTKAVQKNPAPVHNPQSASSQKEQKKKEASEPVVVKEKPKRKAAMDTLPISSEDWAVYDCPDEVREAIKLDTSNHILNRSTIVKPTYSLYFLDLLVTELQNASLTHITLPVLHLAEVIAHDVVGSKSLSDLYHLKLSKVCSDLKLYHAASYHQRAAGTVFISEYEQISCRQEISLFKDEQHDQNSLAASATHVGERPKLLSIHADGKGLSGLCLPYLWLEKADVLIQLGLFQPARILLSQAYKALQDIGDKHYLLKCLYLLSVLANCENNHGQAKALLLEGKDLERDAEFWYKTTSTLTEAIVGENKEGGYKKACRILDTTINIFKTMMIKEANRQSEYALLIAKLNARKFAILLKTTESMLQKSPMTSQMIVLLLDICDKMSQTEADLLRCGHKEYRAEFMMEHANILRILGSTVEDEERRHRYYLDAYSVAEQAVSIVEQIKYNIETSFHMEAGGISLPVQRKLVKMKLDLAELSLEIFQRVAIEESKKVQERKNKGELRVFVDEFVRATPDYNSIEQEWKTLGRTVASAALAQLASAMTLILGCDDLRAKCLYLAGKCLRLLCSTVDPIEEDKYWKEYSLDERKAEGNNDVEEPNVNKQLDEVGKQLGILKTRRKVARTYLAQATEILLQSISVAINNRLMDTLSSASLEICSCLGHFDPVTAGLFLALYQSCQSCMMTEDLLLSATHNTSSSQLAALLHLVRYLQDKGDEGPLRRQAEQTLASTTKVWHSLHVTMQFFSIFNELPPNFNILILQHSEDRSSLYGAFLEKSQVSSTQQGKLSQHKETVQAKVARCGVDPQMLSSLLDKMELFKQDMMQTLLKREHQQSCARENSMLERIGKKPAMMGPSSADHESDRRLTAEFHEIVEIMEAYLGPLLLQLDFAPVRQPPPRLSTAESIRTKEKEEKPATASSVSADAGDCIIVLADKSLQQLPLEALGVFKDDCINSVSRDFSLQMLWNRIHGEQTENKEGKRDVKSAKESKPKADQKKKIKPVPTNRVLPANCMPVESHRFKYIVDPYNEVKEPETLSPGYRMNEVLAKYSQQFTAHWEGIIGGSHVPSHAEWERVMTDCGAFIFYGTERLFAHVLLDKVIAMDLSECQLMILLDGVRTNSSFSRQSTIDVQKRESDLLLERPVETALLLSAAGVRSVMLNQWHTTLQQNAARLDLLAEGLLALGKTTGQTVQSQRKVGHDSEVAVREGDISQETREGSQQSARRSMHAQGDPFSCSYTLYGLPSLVVM